MQILRTVITRLETKKKKRKGKEKKITGLEEDNKNLPDDVSLCAAENQNLVAGLKGGPLVVVGADFGQQKQGTDC